MITLIKGKTAGKGGGEGGEQGVLKRNGLSAKGERGERRKKRGSDGWRRMMAMRGIEGKESG